MKLMKDSRCPKCNSAIDKCMSIISRRAPGAGAFSVCIYCAEVLLLGEDGRFSIPTEEQRHGPHWLRALEARGYVLLAQIAGRLPEPKDRQ